MYQLVIYCVLIPVFPVEKLVEYYAIVVKNTSCRMIIENVYVAAAI